MTLHPPVPQAQTLTQSRTAYIDTHLARLRSGPSPSTLTTLSPSHLPATTTPSASLAAAQRQPATVGRLQEIDLGPSAAARNVLATEAATRTLRGEPAPAPASPPAEVVPTKPRLGRDGRPLRKRAPKRRNSEDVKRDRIVEDLLRENRRTPSLLRLPRSPSPDRSTDPPAKNNSRYLPRPPNPPPHRLLIVRRARHRPRSRRPRRRSLPPRVPRRRPGAPRRAASGARGRRAGREGGQGGGGGGRGTAGAEAGREQEREGGYAGADVGRGCCWEGKGGEVAGGRGHLWRIEVVHGGWGGMEREARCTTPKYWRAWERTGVVLSDGI